MNKSPRSLEELVRPHIDSFDYFLGEGLQNVVELLKPVEVRDRRNNNSMFAGGEDCDDVST